METYRFFGLNAAPFDGQPDPRFFHATTSHAESLATLQYALHTGKTCTVVVGESGSGKTLLGRLLTQTAPRRTALLWLHGIGQPKGETRVTVCPPGNPTQNNAFQAKNVTETTLADWTRTNLRTHHGTVVIADNADSLRPHNWEDLLALATREVRTPKPVNLILLGLPTLLDVLAAPTLLRLHRRVFRTCHLARLAEAEVDTYIRHRLNVAGGTTIDIFTPDAVNLIHRFSAGNPALVNQLCDNAMVDAFSEDRRLIDARHIVASVHAITGGTSRKRRSLPTPRLVHPVPIKVRAVALPSRPPAKLQPITRAVSTALATERMDRVAQLCKMAPIVTYAPLDDRLRSLEARLAEALTRVREARQRPAALSAAPLDVAVEDPAG